MSFSSPYASGVSYAVKISVGGINGLTGLAQNESANRKQDYLAVSRDNGQLSVEFAGKSVPPLTLLLS